MKFEEAVLDRSLKSEVAVLGHSVKFEVAVLGRSVKFEVVVPNSPYGLCKATLEKEEEEEEQEEEKKKASVSDLTGSMTTGLHLLLACALYTTTLQASVLVNELRLRWPARKPLAAWINDLH